MPLLGSLGLSRHSSWGGPIWAGPVGVGYYVLGQLWQARQVPSIGGFAGRIVGIVVAGVVGLFLVGLWSGVVATGIAWAADHNCMAALQAGMTGTHPCS